MPESWPAFEKVLRDAPKVDGRDAAAIDVSSLHEIGVEIVVESELRAVVFPSLSAESLNWAFVESVHERRQGLLDHVWLPPSPLNAFLVPLVGRPSLNATLTMIDAVVDLPAFILTGDLTSPVACEQLNGLMEAALSG
jgi:hypothetical protein